MLPWMGTKATSASLSPRTRVLHEKWTYHYFRRGELIQNSPFFRGSPILRIKRRFNLEYLKLIPHQPPFSPPPRRVLELFKPLLSSNAWAIPSGTVVGVVYCGILLEMFYQTVFFPTVILLIETYFV